MKREHHHWFSPILQKEMELLSFGSGGIPVIVFPTSTGRFYEYEDRGMVSAVGDIINRQGVRLYCVDSVDSESWYNQNAHPRSRVLRHNQYEQYILKEVIPFVHEANPTGKLFVTGCSFGGFHAVNLALKHPEVVDNCISLSGSFDITSLMQGYRDQDSYYNNPIEYLPNLTDEHYLNLYRTKVGFILATGEWDFCLDANLKLSRLLDAKRVKHWLDVWGDHTRHDWPWWQMMIKKFLS
jgi:esterase/lipase superfamily enzyme